MTRVERIGDATLYLGDCREVMASWPPCFRVDAVVTSPPYGQQRDYGARIDDWRGLVSNALTATPDCGDTQILVNLGLIHRDGEVVPYWQDFIGDMRAAGWRHFGWYVWDQCSGMTGSWAGRLAPSHEFIFHFNRAARVVNKTKRTTDGKQKGPGQRKADGTSKLKTDDGKPFQPWKIADSVISTARENASGYTSEHPARFPVSFALELIEPFTSPDDVVCDPFMGSGTTGVACAKLGRKFVGVEIEPRYFDIACRRIDDAYKQPRLFAEPQQKPEQLALLDGTHG